MCQRCGNSFCYGACSPRNYPQYNPPFTQPEVNGPFCGPFSKVCWPNSPGYQVGTYPGNYPGPFPNPCGCGKPSCGCGNNGCINPTTSDCVTVSTQLLCLGVAGGTSSLSTVLQKLDATNCCGVWTNMQLTSGCTAATLGLQLLEPSGGTFPYNFPSPPQYKEDGCGTVSLRGYVQIGPVNFTNNTNEFTSLYDPNIAVSQTITVLPVGFRPKNLVTTKVFGKYNSGRSALWTTVGALEVLLNVYLFIDPSGNVFFGASGVTFASSDHNPFNFQLSMDNVQFSIN